MILAQQEGDKLPADITDPIRVVGGLEGLFADGAAMWLFLILAVALSAGALLFRQYYLKRKKAPSAKGQLSPRREALDHLDRVRDMSHQMDAADVAAELRGAVRTYLRRQYQLDLQSLTTDEYWASLELVTPHLPAGTVEPLAHFFAQCDQLRFQGGDPAPGMVANLIDQAQAIIETPAQPVAA